MTPVSESVFSNVSLRFDCDPSPSIKSFFFIYHIFFYLLLWLCTVPFHMASLTPGVLSKLLDNAGNKNVKVTGEHRSPLLQVIEIVPSLDDDPFKTRGFFLKLSDSLHSAYVSISDQDIDLIFSDKIQLGQFVYVSRFDLGSPVPVVCGLKVVPKRRPCVGSPKDLVSSEILQNRGSVDFKGSKNVKKDGLVKKVDSKTKRLVFDDWKTKLRNGDKLGNRVFDDSRTKLRNDDKLGTKKTEGLELRRLSLDSSRRVWDQPRNSTKNASSAKAKQSFKSPQNAASVASDKKDSFKNDSLTKRPSFSISPLTNKNDLSSPKPKSMPSSPKPKTIPLKEDFKSSAERTIPCHLVKVPFNNKSCSNHRISWDVLPPSIQDIGKDAMCNRNVAFLAAVRALEEASALEAVTYCLQAFAELCDSSHKVSAGPLVEQFLDLHQSMQKAAIMVNSLINNTLPEAKSSTCSLQRLLPDVCCNTLTNKNAASWVHAAIQSDLSKFSLLRKQEKSEIVNGEKYVILENTPKVMNSENHMPENKPSPRNHGSFSSDSTGKRVPSSPMKQHFPSTKKTNPERKEWSKGSGLKEAASLADKLLSVSHQWFLKYLEDSLNTGFGPSREGNSEITSLLRQLKRVNEWLNDLVGSRVDTDDRIEDLRKKLYRFLLDHVDSAGK